MAAKWQCGLMLAKSGAKLMDFGLAKSAPAMAAVSSSSLTMELTSPAATHPLTGQGFVVGTFQYMSPEQVEGKEADTRSDIFALGSVLYEMATGKRAFEGKSSLSVASAILEKEPEPITTIQPMAPPALDHVIRGCLAKNPDDRWQSAGDIARELRWISSSGSSQSLVPAVAPRRARKNWERAGWIALAVILMGITSWLALRPQPAPRVVQAFLTPPTGAAFEFNGDLLASSPTGNLERFLPQAARLQYLQKRHLREAAPGIPRTSLFTLRITGSRSGKLAPMVEPRNV